MSDVVPPPEVWDSTFRLPDHKELKTFPGEAHGTELFDRESEDALRELLLNFLVGLR